ncbi:Imm5 family immunity protein [Bacteroides sp. 519]|uniref:Imm5 family immunity protein n=1 Tax=Bacteroides sp. 519 TaxID=2302937 RepID=UPI0013D5FBAC|nr:Imm5 family immunity protein [Bacteroides sp. 519]NDV56541.1 hypothetical protein [Bacteroides sp. 519]
MENRILKLRTVIMEDTKGHLPLSYRVSLMQDIGNIQTINRIFFECIKYVQEIWLQQFPSDNSVFSILKKAEDYLYKSKGNKNEFAQLSEQYKNFFEEVDHTAGLVGLGCISLSNSILYDASPIINIDEYKRQDDNSYEWDVWNPDFYASMAYSGGNPFQSEGDISKRRDFWLWYLDMILKINQSHDTQLLSISIPSLSTEKTILERAQTYQTESILKKIDTVINNTLDSFRKDHNEKWDKIIIEARCMDIGIQVRTFFTIGAKDDKIRGNLGSFDLMGEVKDEMYIQAQKEGAWIMCTIEVYPDMEYKVNFNYDDRNKLPEERLKAPENFIEEFSSYPRSKEFTPLWWQDILGKKGKYIK